MNATLSALFTIIRFIVPVFVVLTAYLAPIAFLYLHSIRQHAELLERLDQILDAAQMGEAEKVMLRQHIAKRSRNKAKVSK